MTFSPLVVEREIWSGKVGGPNDLGRWVVIAPENQKIIIDYTAPMGGCTNLYWSLVFWLPKQDYKVKKVDEFMEVSPVHTDIYNLLVGQRERIESQIKSGLASAAQAVVDYELLNHDYRRYIEIWEYIKRGKSDSHVLRSLFVDRIDVHTGEGYSLISMAKRWPTIITDFIRMGSPEFKDKKWESIDEIRKALDVPKAEATVLKTKNELYKEWLKLFIPELKERIIRIKVLMDARKKSIDQYKRWLRPYVARHKMMEEALERSPSASLTNPYMLPAFGQAVMSTGVRLWAWKPLIKLETHKYESIRESGIPEIDPYDDVVKEYQEKIEKEYNVQFTESVIKKLINEGLKFGGPHGERNVQMEDYYFIFFDMKIERFVIRVPGGGEIEDLVFNPLSTLVLSQNALLIHLMELWARERQFEREVDELIGLTDEKKEIEKLEREYEKAGKEGERKSFRKPVVSSKINLKKVVKPISRYLIRPGPYENNFKERITKFFLVASGYMYIEVIGFIKDLMGVGITIADVYKPE